VSSTPRTGQPASPTRVRPVRAQTVLPAVAHARRVIVAHAAAFSICILALAYMATRLALLWRFPWFVDETTFATFARDVHGGASTIFIAESDKKGLLPSWLGAGLIGSGLDPVTAMRVLAAAGGGAAAACGGLLIRRFYGGRAALATAALIALGPYFLVTASVGIYDAMSTGLIAAGVLIAVQLARRPRLSTALALGACLGAGALTKPTAWIAAAVVPFTVLLIDRTSSGVTRRAWAGYAALALALGYALSCIARLTPLYDRPIAQENERQLSEILHHFPVIVATNGATILGALIGYLTLPLLMLAIPGGIVARRRHPAAATILFVWTFVALTSSVLVPLRPNPRYFAPAIVPLCALIALGALALLDFLRRRLGSGAAAQMAIVAATAIALVPAATLDWQVLADPVHATYPGLDQNQYVTRAAAFAPLVPIARQIERRGGPYPVRIDVGSGYIWGLDLRLNGAAVGSQRRYDVYGDVPGASSPPARYLLTDAAARDTPPRPGFRLIGRIARPDGGRVMRLYERVQG
jgi:Dolichyl-phosphate-mannose-protein mannosyltransferase